MLEIGFVEIAIGMIIYFGIKMAKEGTLWEI